MTSNTGSDFIFELESVRSLGVQEQILAWAERVFAEPRLVGQSFDVRMFDATRINAEQEAQLYNDFQGRDSELGMGLLNWRKAELSEVISVVRSAVAKRYLTISMTRTRIDAIEKINQSEPNPKLRYSPKAIEELQADSERATRELSYLRSRISQMHALENLLRVIQKDNAQSSSRITEQLLRLLGQSWRGFLRVRAWDGQFRNLKTTLLPNLPNYNFNRSIQGYLIKLGEEGNKVVIPRDTAHFLTHMLEAINRLAEACIPILRNPEDLHNNSNWYPLSTMLRAIVEFFHFCNFEMPIFYLDVAIDLDDPARLYTKEENSWRTMGEGISISSTYKRISAEAALLLAESTSLLECTDGERLDRFLKYETFDAPKIEEIDGREVQPFISCGLCDFDMDPAEQKVKFRTSFPLMDSLIDQLIKGQNNNLEGIKYLRNSPLGSALDTVLGMALLDPKAFGLPPGSINGMDRFRFLAQFWRIVARRRAIGMLGEDYVQNVGAGLQTLGQPGPEHPTFLSMKLPAVVLGREQVLNNIAGTTTIERDALPGLLMDDQVRIIDLINISWAIADDFLVELREIDNENQLRDAIGTFPRIVGSYRSELAKRFNQKWLTSMNWVWAMVRGISPMLWDFWSKVGADRAWDEMIARAPVNAAIGLLLRLFCDSVRLVLLLEISGSAVASGLRVNAESASQNIMLGIERFLISPNAPAVVRDSIDYYFDPEIGFDSWLAFMSSYKTYLRCSIFDLQQMNATVEHWQLLERVYDELEDLYPTRVVAVAPVKQRTTREYHIGFLDEPNAPVDTLRLINESDASLFYNLAVELLGVNDYDGYLFLRLMAMFRRKEKQDWIQEGVHYRSSIEQLLPEYRYRRLIYNVSSKSDSFFRLLKKLDEEGRTSHVALDVMRPQVVEYFEHLNEAFTTTKANLNDCPRILPREGYDLLVSQPAEGLAKVSYPFYLMLICDHAVIYLDTDGQSDEARVIARTRAILEALPDFKDEDPLIDMIVLCGGQLEIVNDRTYIYGGNYHCEPAFLEPDKPMSRLLLSKYVSHKFALVLEILHTQFPDRTFVVRP